LRIIDDFKMKDLLAIESDELLAMHAAIGEVLRERGVLRSSNNPVGDLAEYIFCKAFEWEQAPNSVKSYDAQSKNGTRYQIKGRRPTKHSKSRQLSILRDLDHVQFDYLAGVVFREDYKVFRAAIVPHELVLANATFRSHTRGWVFTLNDTVWDWNGVEDVTAQLQAVKL